MPKSLSNNFAKFSRQLSATRRKRKEREENLKKQAASTKKRKQDLETLENAKVLEEPEEPAEDSDDVEDRVLMEIDEPINPVLSARGDLPDLLPAEYLEDTIPQELIVHPAATSRETKAKKTKFQGTREKLPKDKRIGSTIYRVSKTQSTNLAPKSSFHARSTKEAWLQGRVGQSGNSCRQPMSKGFFRK